MGKVPESYTHTVLHGAHPVLTVEEEAVQVNPAAKPSRATLRRIGQLLDDYHM